jgi:hypothetical protein
MTVVREESRLVAELTGRHWVRGDEVQAMVPVSQHLNVDRHRVRGLDELGNPRAESLGRRAFDAVESMFDDSDTSYVAVRGEHPQCAAIGMYRAARFEHAWLVITSHRVAVLRLRDQQNAEDGKVDQLVEEARQQGSLGGALRGIGKIVKTSATEFVRNARRPPLHERPQDAVLEWPFEAPRHVLVSIVPWKIPMTPQFSGGPRLVQVQFTDNSWTRLETDQTGQSALIGS